MAVENSLLNSANTLFGADIIQRNEENPLEQRNLRKAACRRKRRHSLSLSSSSLSLSEHRGGSFACVAAAVAALLAGFTG